MAKPSEDAEFETVNKKNQVFDESDAAFGFPSEFPYEFDSTENSDEEDFFAGLTRRLSHASIHETRKQLTLPIHKPEEKARVVSGSPQSTLSGIGSWSGRSGGSSDGSPNGSTRVPSPTTTPFPAGNDAWEVLYEAAGQVARLKMNNEASKFDFQNRGVLGGLPPPVATENRNPAFFANQNLSHVQYQQVVKQQCGPVWGRQVQAETQAQTQAQGKANNWSTQQVHVLNRAREFGYDFETVSCTRPLVRSAAAWNQPPQVKQQNYQAPFSGSGSRPVLQGGSSVKRGCGGTGVFLPRQYVAPPPESRKKTSCAPVLVPAKVIHALNLSINDLNAARQPRFSGDFGVDYDALLARRNAILMQQRLSVLREEAAACEIRLPQDWTY